jgi:hypothetical protein
VKWQHTGWYIDTNYSEKCAVSTLLVGKSLTHKTEEADSSGTLVPVYQTTWHRAAGDSRLHTHCHENLKCYILCSWLKLNVVWDLLQKQWFKLN